MGNPSPVVVLAEDRRQQEFIRRGGSGEQWVRKQYATQVKAVRTRAAKASSALVIAIDADTGTVAARHRQLASLLEQASLSARSGVEPVVHLIPKRNVETWILCLTGTAVDE
jgi:hypothetical protein